MYQYKCEIKRVVDGDTVDVDIDLGFGVWLSNQRIRILGIDAPETRTRDLEEKARGLEAKAYVENLLPEGSIQVLHTTQFKKGKFGRILGDFQIYDRVWDASRMLTEVMLRDGMAEIYGD